MVEVKVMFTNGMGCDKSQLETSYEALIFE
jgi:hypothetical protein